MRLFVAIPVDDQIKRRMLRVCDDIDVRDARVRWCSAELLHLTLKFIGEVEDSLLKPICEAVQRVADKTPLLEMEIRETGCFPAAGPVRVIWIGGSESSGTLLQAVQELEDDLAPLGITKEKRTFSEHFTIGRVKFDHSRGRLRESVGAAGFDACRQAVRELVLYQSTLCQSGAQYLPILRAKLQG